MYREIEIYNSMRPLNYSEYCITALYISSMISGHYIFIERPPQDISDLNNSRHKMYFRVLINTMGNIDS